MEKITIKVKRIAACFICLNIMIATEMPSFAENRLSLDQAPQQTTAASDKQNEAIANHAASAPIQISEDGFEAGPLSATATTPGQAFIPFSVTAKSIRGTVQLQVHDAENNASLVLGDTKFTGKFDSSKKLFTSENVYKNNLTRSYFATAQVTTDARGALAVESIQSQFKSIRLVKTSWFGSEKIKQEYALASHLKFEKGYLKSYDTDVKMVPGYQTGHWAARQEYETKMINGQAKLIQVKNLYTADNARLVDGDPRLLSDLKLTKKAKTFSRADDRGEIVATASITDNYADHYRNINVEMKDYSSLSKTSASFEDFAFEEDIPSSKNQIPLMDRFHSLSDADKLDQALEEKKIFHYRDAESLSRDIWYRYDLYQKDSAGIFQKTTFDKNSSIVMDAPLSDSETSLLLSQALRPRT